MVEQGGMKPVVNLRRFLESLEKNGELKRISVEVNPELEITEIATRVVREKGPALFFERVKGAKYPLVINLFGSEKRMEWALGRHPQAIGEELAAFLERLNPPSLQKLWQGRRTLLRFQKMRTKTVGSAPCQEVTEPPDLSQLPIMKCWPEDGGRFLTFPLVITHDLETGIRNVGLYRMHLYSKDSTGMHWQIQKGGGFHYDRAEKQGRDLPVSVVIGADPILLFASMAPLPEGFDEVAFSGFLRGEPTRMVPAKTNPHLVPAEAEFVLEGVVPQKERALEGPFGDHFGHYSHAAPFPVFHVNTVTRRKNPIYIAAVVGKPPQEDKYMGNAVQDMFLPLIRLMHPEIRDLWAYSEAGFHNLLVVSVEQRYGKEALKTGLGLLGEGQLSLTKCMILVDSGVDVKNFSAVLRQIDRNFDPAYDFLLLPGVPLDTLDFTSFTMNLGSKMILDATTKPRGDGKKDLRFRDPRSVDERIQAWKKWEETLLVVQVADHGRAVVENLVKQELGQVKIVAAVSPDVDLDNRESLLWGIFTRFDAARDICFTRSELRGACPIHRGVLGIDATFKKGYPLPIEMDPQITEGVTRRWPEYRI